MGLAHCSDEHGEEFVEVTERYMKYSRHRDHVFTVYVYMYDAFLNTHVYNFGMFHKATNTLEYHDTETRHFQRTTDLSGKRFYIEKSMYVPMLPSLSVLAKRAAVRAHGTPQQQ